jgi:hypothetical protein
MSKSYATRALLSVVAIAIMVLCPLSSSALVISPGASKMAAKTTVEPTFAMADLPVDNAPGSSRALRGPLGSSAYFDATGYSNGRKLLRDTNNVLHAIFSNGNGIVYTNSTDSGVSWFSPLTISNLTPDAKHPAMAIAGNHMYVVWEDGPNISFRRSPDLGSSWIPSLSKAPIVLISNATNRPKTPVVAASNLNVVIAWSSFDAGTGSYEIKNVRSGNNGSTFSGMASLTNLGKGALYPSLSANDTNYYLVYYSDNPGVREVYFRSSANSGGTWTPAVAVSKTTTDSVNPSIVSNGTKLYLVWVEITTGNPEILFKKSTDGGTTWDINAQLISSNPSFSVGPMVALVPNGDIFVVWFDNQRSPHNDTFLRRFNTTSQSWDPTFQATDLDEGYSQPAVNPFAANGKIEWIFTNGRQPTFSIYYYYHLTAVNAQPTLTWTGETNYESSGLFPESGHTTADVYTFRINYSDADNNEPLGGVRVLVDYNQDGRFDWYDNNENYPMLENDPWDDDYRDGNFYSWAMKFPGLGNNYKYRFYAFDSNLNLATGVGMNARNFPKIAVVDHEPRLLWTNEKGYSSDGVEPNSGTSSTNFTWHVSYMQQDNNSPAQGYPKVLIDINHDDYFDLTEYFNMTEVDTEDKAVDDGKFYTYSTTLPDVSTYTYRFVARDSWNIPNAQTDKPSKTMSGPTITIINTAPIVTFPTGFTKGLDKSSGSTSGVFTFKIIYTDNENNTPEKGYPKVWIDKDLDGIFAESEKILMVSENTSNKNYASGVVYMYQTQFSTVGTYKYRFEARDIYDQQAVGSNVGSMTGPDITKANDAPSLTYPLTEGFSKDGVNPDQGRDTTLFTYQVLYIDINNDQPLSGYPQVWVDKDLDQKKDAEELFTMSALDPLNTNYATGVIYTYSTKLSKIGRFTYSFDAWDGSDGRATGLATKAAGGPNVDPKYNNPPVLDWAGEAGFTIDGVDPDSGANTQTFTYKVKYIDYDNDTPAENFPKIFLDITGDGGYNDSNERQVLWEEDKNVTDHTKGKVYIYVTDLSTSFTMMGTSYSYKFVAQDSQGADAILGKPILKTFGPSITSGNSMPELSWVDDTSNYVNDGVNPENGNTTTKFYYRVLYTDPDNDPPILNSPKVFIDNDILGRTMVKEKSSDDNYVVGVIYVYNTTLNLGSHRYRFLAFDQYNTKASAADPPMQTTDGPVVEINNPPVLTWTTDGKYKAGVSKASPTIGTKSVFKVVYSDPEGDKPAPGYPRLLIDLNDDGQFTGVLENIEMVQDSGSDYKSGVTYYMELTLGKGKHVYKFEARDVKGNVATGDPTNIQTSGVNVKAASSSASPGMLIYVVFIVIIVVAAVVAFLVGRKMGGAKTTKKPEAPAEPAQPSVAPETAAQPGYQYPPEAYQGQQYQAPAPVPEPQPSASAPVSAPAPEKPPEAPKPIKPPEHPPKPAAPPKA